MNDKVKEINEGALEVAEAIIKKYDDGIITVNDIYCKCPHSTKYCFEIQDYITIEFNEYGPNGQSDRLKTYKVSCYCLSNDILEKELTGNLCPPMIYKVDSMIIDRTSSPKIYTSFSLYINKYTEDIGSRAESLTNKVLSIATEQMKKKYFLGEVHKKNENESMDAVYDRILGKTRAIKEEMGLND